ncbi:MAG TPA: hypothetical protein VEQ61_00415 [Thermoleophilaceae bacterium]|nr:hypothetical protein [Thermoleophilaceae bacterium]
MLYNLLGRIVWFVATRFARRKLAHNRVKLSAGATVLGVLLTGVAAARLARSRGDAG